MWKSWSRAKMQKKVFIRPSVRVVRLTSILFDRTLLKGNLLSHSFDRAIPDVKLEN